MTFLQAVFNVAMYLLAMGVIGYAAVWFLGKAFERALDVEGEGE